MLKKSSWMALATAIALTGCGGGSSGGGSNDDVLGTSDTETIASTNAVRIPNGLTDHTEYDVSTNGTIYRLEKVGPEEEAHYTSKDLTFLDSQSSSCTLTFINVEWVGEDSRVFLNMHEFHPDTYMASLSEDIVLAEDTESMYDNTYESINAYVQKGSTVTFQNGLTTDLEVEIRLDDFGISKTVGNYIEFSITCTPL